MRIESIPRVWSVSLVRRESVPWSEEKMTPPLVIFNRNFKMNFNRHTATVVRRACLCCKRRVDWLLWKGKCLLGKIVREEGILIMIDLMVMMIVIMVEIMVVIVILEEILIEEEEEDEEEDMIVMTMVDVIVIEVEVVVQKDILLEIVQESFKKEVGVEVLSGRQEISAPQVLLRCQRNSSPPLQSYHQIKYKMKKWQL
jgi:hypothetical protein